MPSSGYSSASMIVIGPSLSSAWPIRLLLRVGKPEDLLRSEDRAIELDRRRGAADDQIGVDLAYVGHGSAAPREWVETGKMATGKGSVLEKTSGGQAGSGRLMLLGKRLAARNCAWRKPGHLAKLRVHVRLVVVAGAHRRAGERGTGPAQQRERAAEAMDPGVALGRHPHLLAKQRDELRASLRPVSARIGPIGRLPAVAAIQRATQCAAGSRVHRVRRPTDPASEPGDGPTHALRA